MDAGASRSTSRVRFKTSCTECQRRRKKVRPWTDTVILASYRFVYFPTYTDAKNSVTKDDHAAIALVGIHQ